LSTRDRRTTQQRRKEAVKEDEEQVLLLLPNLEKSPTSRRVGKGKSEAHPHTTFWKKKKKKETEKIAPFNRSMGFEKGLLPPKTQLAVDRNL
jgi:hypothetical protein